MPALPLSHHEILELVGPFSRCGRRVDLAASNRLERKLVFKGTLHPADAAAGPVLEEILQLDSLGTGTLRLTRVVRGGGVRATVEAMGMDPAELLAQVDALPAQRQFRIGPGFTVARSYSIRQVPGTGSRGSRSTQPVLTQATVRAGGLDLVMNVPSTRGVSADLELTAAASGPVDLPEDLLAVLGWNWTRLVRTPIGWKSKHRLYGHALSRTRAAEAALDRAAAHLAKTLAEPPECFHDEWRAARWGVFLRRAIPTLTLLCLLIGVGSLPHLVLDRRPGLWMLLFHGSALLIVLSFCLQELPQYEIPPLPRRQTGAVRRPD